MPGKDDVVTIEKDMNVVLDVSPPPLHGLTINRKLSFADKDLELTTEWIMVHGELEIGTEAKLHTRRATITLTDNVKGEDPHNRGCWWSSWRTCSAANRSQPQWQGVQL